jgi:hypothetical protein
MVVRVWADDDDDQLNDTDECLITYTGCLPEPRASSRDGVTTEGGGKGREREKGVSCRASDDLMCGGGLARSFCGAILEGTFFSKFR